MNKDAQGIWMPIEILKMDLNMTEKVVLTIYKFYTEQGEWGYCAMTNESIADFIGCDVSTVKRSKAKLEENGYIERHGIQVKYIKGAQNAPQGGANCPVKGAQNAPHNNNINNKENNYSTYNNSTYNRSVKNEKKKDMMDEVPDDNPNIDLDLVLGISDNAHLAQAAMEYDTEYSNERKRVKKIKEDIDDGVFHSKEMLIQRLNWENGIDGWDDILMDYYEHKYPKGYIIYDDDDESDTDMVQEEEAIYNPKGERA